MHIRCYGHDRPWFLVEVGGLRILLDAGLDVHRLQRTTAPLHPAAAAAAHSSDAGPSSKATLDAVKQASLDDSVAGPVPSMEMASSARFPLPSVPPGLDLARVDIWLLSNYWQAAALPYLTERYAFHGRIVATEPTIIYARLYMEELVERFGTLYATDTPSHAVAESSAYARIYSKQDVQRCLDRIQDVRYHEYLSLVGNVQVIAHGAGYCLGSANWRIHCDTLRMAYISSSSLIDGHHSAAFDWTVLEAPLAVTLVADVRHDPAMPAASMIERFKEHVATAARRGGSILLPMYPHGTHFDLLNTLLAMLDSMAPNLPILVVSPTSNRSRQYSDILGEWMQPMYRDRMYIPENPLIDEALISSGKLSYHTGFQDESFMARYREPCIVFCGDPSLQAGEVTHWLQMWRDSTRNSIILTDPHVDHERALRAYGHINAEVVPCAIDLRLTPEMCRRQLVPRIPTDCICLLPAHIFDHTRDTPDARTRTYRPNDTVHLPAIHMDNGGDRDAWITEPVARQLHMRTLQPGQEVGICNASLNWRQGQLFLDPVRSEEQRQQRQHRQMTDASFYGRVSAELLTQHMLQRGILVTSTDTDPVTGRQRIQARWQNIQILVLLGEQQSEVLAANTQALELMTSLFREQLLEL